MATVACVVCKNTIGDGERFVLLRRGREEVYCSQVCLVARVERQRRARTAARRRWLLRATAIALVIVGAPRLWHRVRLPQPEAISLFDLPEVKLAEAARPEPPMFGPAWPPTDDDWSFAFAHTAWTYPLPGPARRLPVADDRILTGRASLSVATSAGHAPATCRPSGRCGVDVGGDLWGEHVYAVHDGVVDRVQRAAGDERGDVYLRLAHFGGMVFTHYVHLAAVPRGIAPGVTVKAGDLVGLVGDTGNERPGPSVHFALSVRPSSVLPEVYWDPTDLMAHWPLRLPPHGTVAGFVPSDPDLRPPPFFRRRR